MKFTIRYVYGPDKQSNKSREILDDLDQELFPGEEIYNKDTGYWWLVYNKNNKPIGFAGLDIFTDGRGFLCRSGVLSEARGHGIQKRLIKLRESKAKKEKIKVICTYTSHDNIYSCNNLIICGYKRYEPKYIWGIDNGLYFYKNL